MTVYYLLQHLAVALGLACCAICLPHWVRLPLAVRALLAASLTPHVIGLVVMALALADVNTSEAYKHAPIILGLGLPVLLGHRAAQHLFRHRSRLSVTLPSAVLMLIGCFVALVLAEILYENAGTLSVSAHDFNVYMAGAKSFAESPGITSIPSFIGQPGDVIVVHPHSFLFEAYLSHALFVQGVDTAIPALDFLPRLAQQLSLVYLLLSVAAVAVTIGEGKASIAALCLVLCVPWVYYIAGTLSRDGFRMVPLYGFMTILVSLTTNFRTHLIQRGVLAGVFAALAVMSHTLNILFLALSGGSIFCYALLCRRANWNQVGKFLVPVALIGFLALFRYLQNYSDTGSFMGYGLQYSIYKGTWMETMLGERWTKPALGFIEVLRTLFLRYGWLLQMTSVLIALVVLMLPGAKRKNHYIGVLIGMWIPLLILVASLFNHAGINISTALVNNARYPLPYFLLSVVFLTTGAAYLVKYLVVRFRISDSLGDWLVVCVTACTAYLAYDAMQARGWSSYPSRTVEIEQIRFLDSTTQCLADGQQWLVNGDRWNVYFKKHPPLFLFTLPARPLLRATEDGAVSAALAALNIEFIALIEPPKVWHDTPLYAYIKSNWTLISISDEEAGRELWASPDIADCIKNKPSPLGVSYQ